MAAQSLGSLVATPKFGPSAPARRGVADPLGQSACLPSEIAFLAGSGVDLAALQAAAQSAKLQGVSPDSALLAAETVSEPFFYRAFARKLGVAFIDGEATLRPDLDYRHAIRSGLARLDGDRARRFLAAPRGEQLAVLLQLACCGVLPPTTLAITTPSNLSRRVRAASADLIAEEASLGLPRLDASLSARAGPTLAQYALASCGMVILALVSSWVPELAADMLSMGTSCLFLPAIFLRLFASAASGEGKPRRSQARIPERGLPTYSIIVALHREARVARQLIEALDAIEYPRGKLDIKLVLEEDDYATRRALEALALGPMYEIIVAPLGYPRTKPRALNVALPLLRGEFVAIFDAEDAPDPLQLREAAERFLHAPRSLACLQARLAIDNIDDSWLTRLFAIEYAVLFDVLHQGMAGMQLPFPLGGSSNHFRTSVLREVGGWDAWNVTEDADLGLRLARFGYKIATIESSTREEAPAFLSSWMKQRRRWSKGWMQTFVTLSRDPYRLLREIGIAQTFVLVLMMTALVIAPLLWPFFTGLAIRDLAISGVPSPGSSVALVRETLWSSVLVFGAGSTLWLALLGMRRRKLLGLWPYLPLILPYYLLMSIAAWAALHDLARRPHHWLKTEHGLARSSRRNGLGGAARTVSPPKPRSPTDAGARHSR